MTAQIAVLFVRADSCYKRLPGIDAWDAERDALRWPGGVPAVYHPPCRAWATLRHHAKPREGRRISRCGRSRMSESTAA